VDAGEDRRDDDRVERTGVPIETITTSPPCFSFSRIASSTPISSKGFSL
jgi:hypothetical protein